LAQQAALEGLVVPAVQRPGLQVLSPLSQLTLAEQTFFLQ